jgi:hypothetical protein
MFWALILCAGAGQTQTCLPPQYFSTQQACVGIGNAYKRASSSIYSPVVACVKIPITDVVR